MIQKGTALIPILILILVFVGIIGGAYYLKVKNTPQKPVVTPVKVELPKNPFPYQRPTLPLKRAYITFLVGDSIVGALGENADLLRKDLIVNYPGHEFVNYNYGFGSTNILTVPDRLNKEATYLGKTFPAINGQSFDLIIFESFAYNPLSELPVAEGLKKQSEILDSSIKEIIEKHPNSVVAIMTPIAPSEEFFAKGVENLTPEVRKQWVEERVAYIKNAIEFAGKNNIPLINVYEKSLTPDGKADLKYIDPHDYIHPSVEGVKLISKTIADYILQNHIFPE